MPTKKLFTQRTATATVAEVYLVGVKHQSFYTVVPRRKPSRHGDVAPYNNRAIGFLQQLKDCSFCGEFHREAEKHRFVPVELCSLEHTAKQEDNFDLFCIGLYKFIGTVEGDFRKTAPLFPPPYLERDLQDMRSDLALFFVMPDGLILGATRPDAASPEKSEAFYKNVRTLFGSLKAYQK